MRVLLGCTGCHCVVLQMFMRDENNERVVRAGVEELLRVAGWPSLEVLRDSWKCECCGGSMGIRRDHPARGEMGSSADLQPLVH